MAYTKNKWKCGDSVTAEKLNNIEQGIANGSGSAIEPFYVDFDHYAEESPNPPVYNKTWQEAYDVFMSGRPVFVDASNDPLFSIVSDIDIAVLQVVAMTEQPGTGSVQTTYRALLGRGSKDYLLATDTTPYLYWYHNGTK